MILNVCLFLVDLLSEPLSACKAVSWPQDTVLWCWAFSLLCNDRGRQSRLSHGWIFFKGISSYIYFLQSVSLTDYCCNFLKPKFHDAAFPKTSPWHVSRGSFEEVGDLSQGSRSHGSWNGKTRGSFQVSDHRNMSRWFEKIPWHAQIWLTKYMQNERISWDSLLSASEDEKVADFPVSCRGQDTGKSATSRTSLCLVTGLSRTSRGIRHNGIWTLIGLTLKLCTLVGYGRKLKWKMFIRELLRMTTCLAWCNWCIELL